MNDLNDIFCLSIYNKYYTFISLNNKKKKLKKNANFYENVSKANFNIYLMT